MEREIRTRVFYDGKWWDPALVGGTQVPQVFNDNNDLVNLCSHLEEYHVCQFVGLYDRDGVKVFDGDICESRHYPKAVLLVVWDEELLTHKMVVYSQGVECEDVFFIKSDWDKYKVIGNIYENPNLVKYQKDVSN